MLVCQLGVEDCASSAEGPAAAPGPRHRGHHATFLAKVGRPVVSKDFEKARPEVVGPPSTSALWAVRLLFRLSAPCSIALPGFLRRDCVRGILAP